jgi:hypothetical protein
MNDTICLSSIVVLKQVRPKEMNPNETPTSIWKRKDHQCIPREAVVCTGTVTRSVVVEAAVENRS